MALTPGIPTSFVPRQPAPQAPRRLQSSGTNLFLAASLIVGAAALAAAAGSFAYQKYLTYQLEQKMELLSEAQAGVSEEQVEDFVRLRDRLSSGSALLSNQIVLSRFFDTLEDLTLQNVRFNSMELAVAGDGSANLEVEGTARNFNTLAAQSNAFAGERGIRRAIFSSIALTDTRQVTFRLTADIDARLVTAGRQATPLASDPLTLPVQPVATTSTSVATTSAPRPGTSTPPATVTAPAP